MRPRIFPASSRAPRRIALALLAILCPAMLLLAAPADAKTSPPKSCVAALRAAEDLGVDSTTYRANAERCRAGKAKAAKIDEAGLAEQKAAAEAAHAAEQAERAAAALAAAEAARNTIPGEGIFAIGADKNPGRYTMAGSPDCYYAIRSAPNGFEGILDNNNIDGPAIIDLAAGQFLETTRCAQWTRVG
jgi:hypothetical protein